MNERDLENGSTERRSENRRDIEDYASVEFFQEELSFPYQFKIRNFSTKGMCILVKEDSDVLEHFSVGRQFEMKYYSDATGGAADLLKTEIIHMTKGEFKGHCLVGLAIIK